VARSGAASFLTGVCSFAQDGAKYFVLQLLPEGGGPAAGAGLGRGAETGIWHKQKLDCALQLARTVSLDFNNALTSILGHTSLLLSRLEPNHPWRGSLIEVEKSAARAAEIASDLGSFSRQDKEVRTQAAGNLNLLLQRTVEYFQQKPGTADPVAWGLQLERRLFAAKFDEAKMQQVFMKVFENALEALAGTGRVGVQTRNLELTQATQDRNVQLAAGAYVCAEITDNGSGIDPEVLPRIFEPFFTTKRNSNHRGLGLAWVYGIVTNHGGGVAVSSEPGVGTSVRVYLPAERRVVKDNGLAGDDLGGNATILMVDDEDLLLTMGQTILSSYGYRVLTANSGQKALELLSRTEGGVDLVITDLVMPSMGGRELVEHIRRLVPDQRILCTSGYVWPSSPEEDTAYLQKPFTSQELLLKVKAGLATDRPNSA
jgi:two-component system, cell cycle sensor histidine kinase and response regulator CckA